MVCNWIHARLIGFHVLWPLHRYRQVTPTAISFVNYLLHGIVNYQNVTQWETCERSFGHHGQNSGHPLRAAHYWDCSRLPEWDYLPSMGYCAVYQSIYNNDLEDEIYFKPIHHLINSVNELANIRIHRLNTIHNLVFVVEFVKVTNYQCDIWPLIGIKRMASHSIV